MDISYARIPIRKIKPNPLNARTHSKKQVDRLAASIKAHGLLAPIIADEHNVIVAGHARLEAARAAGLLDVPVLTVRGLSQTKKRSYMLADNRIAQDAGWDRERLSIEIPELEVALAAEGLDISILGFEVAELDRIVDDAEDPAQDPADEIDASCTGPAVSQPGDLWQLGRHRLLCGDARAREAYVTLLGQERAHAAITDPPYNVAIKGVVGRGARKHREFAMASGEMSDAEFVAFLCTVLGLAASHSAPGAVHYAFMDWRHYAGLAEAARQVYSAVLNMVVWVKTNAGQGSFYRSQHELIGVFKVGDGRYLNNIELGRHGRNRSNVWQYAGVNSFRAGRLDELQGHPTVKPVAMIVDAMKDCTRRGEVVLDPFCGSGTTVLAAERAGRQARCLEIDPIYVDLAVRRWQAFTGRDAAHAETGLTFDEMGERRSATVTGATARSPARRSRSTRAGR